MTKKKYPEGCVIKLCFFTDKSVLTLSTETDDYVSDFSDSVPSEIKPWTRKEI